MGVQDNQPTKQIDGYFQQTRYPLNSLVLLVPLLVVFHVGAAKTGTHLLAPHLIGKFLAHFGATADLLAPLLVVAVLLVQHGLSRRPWRVQPFPLLGMVAESIIWTVPLIALSQLTGRIIIQDAPAAQALATESATLLDQVILSIGAGIYEEFLFRLALVSLALLVFVDAFDLKKQIVVPAVIVVGAILFSLCHFSPAALTQPAELNWTELIFLVMAGLLWGCVYVYRGFGIVVGAHILWDLYVTVY